jgi:hypothetical protein
MAKLELVEAGRPADDTKFFCSVDDLARHKKFKKHTCILCACNYGDVCPNTGQKVGSQKPNLCSLVIRKYKK